MFSMEVHLVLHRRLEGILGLGKASIGGKQKQALKMDCIVSYVFDHNKKDMYLDICIKQKYAHDRPHTVTMHHKCC